MKFLFSLTIVFSFSLFAEEDGPKYEALEALGGSCENQRSFAIVPVKS